MQYNRKEWWDNLVMSYSATRDQSYVIYNYRSANILIVIVIFPSLKDIASDLSTLYVIARGLN